MQQNPPTQKRVEVSSGHASVRMKSAHLITPIFMVMACGFFLLQRSPFVLETLRLNATVLEISDKDISFGFGARYPDVICSDYPVRIAQLTPCSFRTVTDTYAGSFPALLPEVDTDPVAITISSKRKLHWVGRILLLRGDYGEARHILSRASAADKQNPWVNLELSDASFLDGHYRDALRAAEAGGRWGRCDLMMASRIALIRDASVDADVDASVIDAIYEQVNDPAYVGSRHPSLRAMLILHALSLLGADDLFAQVFTANERSLALWLSENLNQTGSAEFRIDSFFLNRFKARSHGTPSQRWKWRFWQLQSASEDGKLFCGRQSNVSESRLRLFSVSLPEQTSQAATAGGIRSPEMNLDSRKIYTITVQYRTIGFDGHVEVFLQDGSSGSLVSETVRWLTPTNGETVIRSWTVRDVPGWARLVVRSRGLGQVEIGEVTIR